MAALPAFAPKTAPKTATDPAPNTTTFRDTRDPLQARYDIDAKLPRRLREEAAGMDWGLFMATYAPAATLHVALTATGHSLWAGTRYSATVTAATKTQRPHTATSELTAAGPAAAASQVLAEHDRYVEILSFHQIELYSATVTCVEVCHQVNHNRRAWAIGFGATPTHSVAAALSSGAQRIYGNL
ncbi:hypothetical protein [Corynebacterium timonense]|uniref:Acetyl-CoA acetyltransferase n=1 Tax=Corynebacterium timonense TaxID=441500 RepID=A0A1H1L2J1_9CORY|nr:hypothetical protein [Corynebacterium timonense]SDR68617.1 hypothetical protein SAMN04488539_0028 [Corynebacterium timonense]